MGEERLLVFGYFGGRNFGDELMLLGLLAQAKKAGTRHVRIITPDGAVPRHLEGKVDGAFGKSVSGIGAGLAWASAFAICGGTMFHDAYPDERHRGYRKILVSLAALCVLARFMGRRVLLLGVGLGPFHRRLTRLVTRVALTAAAMVVVRDRASFDDARALGVSASKLSLGQDLALSAEHDLPAPRLEATPEIIVSLVAPELTSTVEGAEARAFHEQLAALVGRLVDKRQQLRLTVMAVGVGTQDNDSEVSAAFARMAAAAGNGSGRIHVQSFDGNPLALASLLAGARAVIATRYHVALAAEMIGAPTFWVAYQRKVADAAAELSVPPERLAKPEPAAAPRIDKWLAGLCS